MGGGYVMYLLLPPISKNHDRDEELALVHEFAGAGIGTRLDSHDQSIYDLLCDNEDRLTEFVYATDRRLRPGKDRAWMRKVWNRLEAQRQEGVFMVTITNTPTTGLVSACTQCAGCWKQDRPGGGGTAGVAGLLRAIEKHDGVVLAAIHDKDRVFVYEADQRVSTLCAVQVLGHRSYRDNPLRDPCMAIQLVVQDYWNQQGVSFLNMGCAVGNPGLVQAKRNLLPVCELEMGTYKPVKLTLEAFVAMDRTLPRQQRAGEFWSAP
jgi:hypothetical protein